MTTNEDKTTHTTTVTHDGGWWIVKCSCGWWTFTAKQWSSERRAAKHVAGA